MPPAAESARFDNRLFSFPPAAQRLFRAPARPTFARGGKSGQKRRSNLRFENPLAPRTKICTILHSSRCWLVVNLSKCGIAPAAIPAAAQDAKCRSVQFYILEQKRQRSEKEVNSTFRTNQGAAASGGRKSKNHGFLAAFFPPFLSLLKEMGPPEAQELFRACGRGSLLAAAPKVTKRAA